MNDSDDNSNNSETEQDNERLEIKRELSTLSFEDLQKLKEKVGAKVYKEVVFGKSQTVCNEKKVLKRENKNRPREISSKKPVSMLQDIVPVKKVEVRDPRFDPLSGDFDKKEFSENYGFLTKIRMNDIKVIKAELRQTTDPDKELKLRKLLQRLNDQHKASKKRKLEKEKLKRQKANDLDDKEGKQPYFKNKSESRVESLVKQYEELKKAGTGRIQRHLKRRQQKIKKKSFRNPLNVE